MRDEDWALCMSGWLRSGGIGSKEWLGGGSLKEEKKFLHIFDSVLYHGLVS